MPPCSPPGTYSDTILAQETHWYAARLEQGQELTATVTRAGVTGFRSPLGSYMVVAFADPDLTEFGRQRTDTPTDQAHTMRIRTGVVGREPAAGQGRPVLRPGTYAVRVTVEDNPYLSFAGREVPLEVRLDISNGTPAASAVPTSATSAAPTADPAAAEPGDGAGPSLFTIALGVLIVLVLLLAAAVVVLLRRQR